MRPPSRRLTPLVLALAAGTLLGSPARADSGPERLKRAHDTFEYGDFAKTVDLLQDVPTEVELSESERIEAWRMLGLAYFYLHDKPRAESAMFELLKQAPDYQLDPFYVPPDAVAFFDDVRRRHEPYLAPIRERKKEAAQAAKERAEAALARPNLLPATVVLDHRQQTSTVLAAFMPFGIGQYQNGSPKLGTLFLASEVATALVSVGSWLLIEALRSSETGKFSDANYALAEKADTVKFASGAAFYLLWAAGAVEANLDFVPVRDLGTTSRSVPADGVTAEPRPMSPTPAPTTNPPPATTKPAPPATVPSVVPARAPAPAKLPADAPSH